MAYTSALLHCNGANNGTTFTDETGKTWTAAGNTVTSTSSPKFGTASAYFPGSSDSLTSGTSDEFNFGTGAFTIDFWMKSTKVTGYGGIMSHNAIYTNTNGWLIFQNADNIQVWYGGSAAFLIDDAYWGDGAWHHIALTRSTTTLKMYIDGTERGTATAAGIGTHSFGASNIGILMGYQYGYAGTRDFLGYIDELRVSKGVVRWSSNFTPPTAEYVYSTAGGSPSLSPSSSVSPSSAESSSNSPSVSPSRSPSTSPSTSPSSSVSPSRSPSISPSLSPSSSVSPSQSPSVSPSLSPSSSISPSVSPSAPAPEVIDSYSESNQSAISELGSGSAGLPRDVGQSFTGNGMVLDSVKFYLRKNGSPTGSCYAKIYAHSGTYGTSSVATGSALATSDAYDATTLPASLGLITFDFSGVNRITLTNTTYYVVTVFYEGGASYTNDIYYGIDNTSPTHGGNSCEFYPGDSWYSNSSDVIFYVYGFTSTESASLSPSSSLSPSPSPSSSVSPSPSPSSSVSPSQSPSISPSLSPSSSVSPSRSPSSSVSPSKSPSLSPSSSVSPSLSPSSSVSPSRSPSNSPSTSPSLSPSSSISPSRSPSVSPSLSPSSSVSPSNSPSISPSLSPSSSVSPSRSPSNSPSQSPSLSPSSSISPSRSPSVSSSLSPSSSISPSGSPSISPSSSVSPSRSPSQSPSVSPSSSISPSRSPSVSASLSPSIPPFERYNLIINPSFVGSTGWNGGTNETTYVLSGTTSHKYYCNYVNGVAGTQQYLNSTTTYTTLEVGKSYMFSTYVYIPVDSPITRITIKTRRDDWTGGSSANFNLVAGAWTRVYVGITPTFTGAWRLIVSDPLAPEFTGIANWYTDAALLEFGSTVDSYFDGSITGCEWMGTANASISVMHGPSQSASTSPSNSPSVSPSVSPSLSPSASVSPSKSPSLSPSSSVSPSRSPSNSPSNSPSLSPSSSQSPSLSPSSSVSPSRSPSQSPSNSPSQSPSLSPSSSMSPSRSPSQSPSLSPSSSISPSLSPSSSMSSSISASNSPSPSPLPPEGLPIIYIVNTGKLAKFIGGVSYWQI